MFLKQLEVQGFTLSSSPWEMTTISKFPDVLWKTESVCKLLTVGFLHEHLLKQKSILLKNLTGKNTATTWTETPLSCECAPGVKNSAGQSGLQVIKSRNFLLCL